MLSHPFRFKRINLGSRFSTRLSLSKRLSQGLAPLRRAQYILVVNRIDIRRDELSGFRVGPSNKEHGREEHVGLKSGCNEARDVL